MAPGEKIKAKIKKNLPVRGPQAPTIKDLMHWYCMNTNTHGCRRIVVSRGRLRRLLWIAFTLTAVALIIWQCALLVFSFYTVSVSIKVHFQKLDFPAVTICNINPYKYSAVSDLLTDLDSETKQALLSLYGVKESRKRREAGSMPSTLEGTPPRFFKLIPLLVFNENEKGKARDFFTGRKRKISGKIIHKASNVMHVHESKKLVGFQLCSHDPSDCATYTFSSGINAIQEWYKLHYMNIMAQVPLEKKINMSYSAEELLVTCFFDGMSCDARNFTLFHHPMYGNCYTFNNKENATILSTSMGGSEYGLQVILYINEDEYNPFLVSSTGAKVLIHQQNEYPFIEDVGMEIETAMSTSIGMHLTESFKLSEPYSQCTEDGSDVPVTNIYNAAYSLQICLYSCFQTKMVEKCGCAQYSQPLPPAANYCNYQQHPNWMYCYYQLYQAFVREELGCQSVCKQSCSFKEWTLTTSLAQWPSAGVEEHPMSEEEGEEEEAKECVHNRDDRAPWDGGEPFLNEVVLTHVCSQSPEVPCWEPGLPETPGEVDEDSEDICNNTELGKPNQDTGQDTEDASMGSPESEVSPDVQEQEAATDSPEVFEEDSVDAAEGEDQIARDEPPNCEEDTNNRETAAATMQAGEDHGEDGDRVQEDPAEENCQIIPFESDSVEEDCSPTLTENPYELFPTESTSFCNNSGSLAESDKGQESVCKICVEEVPGIGPSLSQGDSLQDGSGEEAPVPEVVVVPENEDPMDDALSSPYVMGVGLLSLGEGAQSDTQAASGTLSGYSTWEEGDSDGGQVPVDRKNIATRARPHSGKVAGHVPETVLEETGPEACSSAMGIRDTGDEVRKIGILPEGKPSESLRALPAKPRAFTLYPRSFSVEGRESPLSMFREPEGAGLDMHRVRRKEDNLSLPGAIGSSGSFSQRSHLPSSGTSTPSSVVDIPPPFDLACITKRPITKSSPSLLIDGDTLEKASKKKKSSFKRFLELTFRKKTESKVHVDMSLSSSRSSSESSYHGPARVLELDRRSLSNSPQLKCHTGKLRASDSPASLIFYRDSKRKGVPFSRTVSRVESFEDRSRPPFLPLPLTKPRSISFPNADTSDYENIPAMNSDYENIQIPPRRPARTGTFTKLFEEQSRALSTANENDGYVDMSSFNAFESKQQSSEQEAESAYTEPYKVCPISTTPKEDLTSDEEQGSSEEEDNASRDPSLSHKGEGQSRAFVIAQELLSSEKAYVQMLQHLSLDFHGAVLRALENVEQEGREPLAQEELRQGLRELPAICDLHQGILESLEQRLGDCGEGQQQVADIFLAREQEFEHHAAHILQFDRYLGLLAESCLLSPRLATTVREFEQSSQGGGQSMKHRMLRVVQRLFQYQVLLTDYLNNLCPDSAEYDNTQSALNLISKVTDRANESMEQGENLQKLVHIEYSVRGQGDLLQPGREFLKEGTLMRVRGKSRHPRHLFLMNDTLLYTHPQKDGKYRLKSSLPVANMKVSRPVMDKVPYALKIETPESCLTLSASSCAERDEWHYCLSRALPEDYKTQALAAFHHSVEIRERLGISLGERLPTLVPVTHAMMCMNCGCDFSLTVRRHHCHACGKIVCRNCSRNKYPLKCLKNRMAKVCDGCFRELKLRNGPVPGPIRERPVSMSFPLSSSRFSSGSTFSSVFQSISPSTFKKQKKVPSALAEVAASGEGSAISGYLSRCKSGKRRWKKLWLVIKGKVLYTYLASEDKVAMESIPLLGFTIAPEKEEGSSEVGPVFHLYHKKTLFYSFKAEDSSSAQRWMEAMEDASVL